LVVKEKSSNQFASRKNFGFPTLSFYPYLQSLGCVFYPLSRIRVLIFVLGLSPTSDKHQTQQRGEEEREFFLYNYHSIAVLIFLLGLVVGATIPNPAKKRRESSKLIPAVFAAQPFTFVLGLS